MIFGSEPFNFECIEIFSPCRVVLPPNALSPIVVTESGMVREVSCWMDLKVPFPIVVTELGMVREVSWLPAKAWSLIVVN